MRNAHCTDSGAYVQYGILGLLYIKNPRYRTVSSFVLKRLIGYGLASFSRGCGDGHVSIGICGAQAVRMGVTDQHLKQSKCMLSAQRWYISCNYHCRVIDGLGMAPSAQLINVGVDAGHEHDPALSRSCILIRSLLASLVNPASPLSAGKDRFVQLY